MTNEFKEKLVKARAKLKKAKNKLKNISKKDDPYIVNLKIQQAKRAYDKAYEDFKNSFSVIGNKDLV